jgi:hypothetical protein
MLAVRLPERHFMPDPRRLWQALSSAVDLALSRDDALPYLASLPDDTRPLHAFKVHLALAAPLMGLHTP